MDECKPLGLGKTLQGISLLWTLLNQGTDGRGLHACKLELNLSNSWTQS